MEKIKSREYASEAVKEFRDTGAYEEVQLETIEISLAIAHEKGEIYQLKEINKEINKGQK